MFAPLNEISLSSARQCWIQPSPRHGHCDHFSAPCVGDSAVLCGRWRREQEGRRDRARAVPRHLRHRSASRINIMAKITQNEGWSVYCLTTPPVEHFLDVVQLAELAGHSAVQHA